MDGYLDFGSDSDNEDSPNGIMEVDSDEEERNQNDQVLKMLMEKADKSGTKSRKEQAIEDFEAEMEAELDRRALEVESEGGMMHQSISRSSSSSSLPSLNKTIPVVPVPALPSNQQAAESASGPSSSKRSRTMLKEPKSKAHQSSQSSPKKSVKFAEAIPLATSKPTISPVTEPTSLQRSQDPTDKGLGVENGQSKRYEDIYFDSDESEGDDDTTRKIRVDKREFLSNDDLLYDPKSDTRDQAWMDKRRRQYFAENKLAGPSSNSSTSTSTKPPSGLDDDFLKSKPKSAKLPPGVKPLPTSDAVLNCPACFTVVCLDCQRHEFNNNQYRAMFVMNCIVNSDEVIRAPVKQRKSKSKANRTQKTFSATPNEADVNDMFNTVKCKVCNTQLGFYDHDEVYHFIDVLASYS